MSVVMEEKYLTTKETLEYLKIGRTKLYQLINEGRLTPRTLSEKKPGSTKSPNLRFKKSELDNLLK